MKKLTALFLILTLLLAGCQSAPAEGENAALPPVSSDEPAAPSEEQIQGVQIVLHDDGITVDGQPISDDESQAVYAGNDIVYYPTGQDFTFGEGTEADAHEASEADGHTVVHITQPGAYVLTGTLSAGQVAVDLGEDAEDDPNAVVTLILNGADITCTVAPAVIFYNVYECGDKDNAAETVDTSAAGANVLVADGSLNNIRGSYVARIYEPDSVELNEDGTEVEDADKLHKYDAAFYSKMSMNVGGSDGVLNIFAENEGLDSELHLTINGGVINITSGNDGINTNEDGVSVTTINGGALTIQVNGETGEGDGIDSNGWLVINGGTVIAAACSFSGDAGIDSDMGIHLNGGTVIATGNMLDRIAGGNQTYAVFTFADTQAGGGTYTLQNSDGEAVIALTPANDFTCLIIAGDQLAPGDYSFYHGELQLEAVSGQSFGGGMTPGPMPGSQIPEEGQEPPEGGFPGGQQPGEGQWPAGQPNPDREIPDDVTPPGGLEPPDEIPVPTDPIQPETSAQGQPPMQGQQGFGGGRGQMGQMDGASTTFTIVQGANYFSFVTEAASEL